MQRVYYWRVSAILFYGPDIILLSLQQQPDVNGDIDGDQGIIYHRSALVTVLI